MFGLSEMGVRFCVCGNLIVLSSSVGEIILSPLSSLDAMVENQLTAAVRVYFRPLPSVA